jgi:sec-independent protein translocase protein TatA
MVHCKKETSRPSPACVRLQIQVSPGEGKQLGGFSLTHWLVVLVIVLIVFGAGKAPRVIGDLAKGIKSFKANMRESEEDANSLPAGATADDRAPSRSR